ncbi:Cytochrome bd-I ubiquinol oxidase subunit 2 [Aquimixticola soesokkakensis]|uniref:Cytochrome bd-I ubiquinol oxidase subunit 2 n=2 Tax=Aquimixticola soesokkakensis TaxID=1519096 RepID=A0A1Y5SKK2_9RHOB|nr:cytochrome d ubiquinol oxidase subunit II [Aquimixticola soesokkakensis]SLN42346.1 Cytochrome bd-I ubiquinol oxidase subunit 2 [Aquimixticola soesokkakensis]
MDYTLIWAFLLAFSVFTYVVLDGFDLGIGILYPFFKTKRERDLLMNSVAPIWDGNETWLVLGGGGLMAAFPMAYAIILPALYPPIIAMLLALILRGVAFEFRWRAEGAFGKRVWDYAFIGGSTLAAFMQGVALGALLQGIEVEGRAYAGGWFDWLTPFSVLTGLAVVTGYAMLGAAWLVWKLDGVEHVKAREIARFAGIATVAFIVAVSFITPYLNYAYYERWFVWPQIAFSAVVPVLVAVLIVAIARSLLRGGRDWVPFVLGLGLFALCFIGLGISMFPYVVPPSVTLYEAAAPEKSQVFMLVGAVVLIPIILGYTAYAYWVFRGKIDPEKGYH